MPSQPRPIRIAHAGGVLAVAGALLLGACATGEPAVDLARDGPKCGAAPAASRVHVQVHYDAGGTPVVTPVDCVVAAGTVVTWRGPYQAANAFTILFRGENPAPGTRGRLPSKATGARQRVETRVDGPPGRYKYDVEANGQVLDPAIIIR